MIYILVKEYPTFQKSNGTLIRNSFISGKGSRNIFLTVLFLFFTLLGSATNYYVSNSGNDTNSGTSESLAWKTLARVNSFTPSPGDQILFKRGDEWSGSITVKASGTSGSPIVYGAYGSGALPVLKGTSEITEWTNHSGNIYKASLDNYTNQIFEDDVKMQIAATDGYATGTKLYIDGVTNTTTFSDASLVGTDWTGSYAVLKMAGWSFESIKVISCTPSTGTVVLEEAPYYTLKTGYPYFMINHISLLDEAGEWCYDGYDSTLYFWASDGLTPTNVEASTVQHGITGDDVENVRVVNISVERFNGNGISFTGDCESIYISNNTLTDNYATAINICYNNVSGVFQGDAPHSSIINNTIIGSNETGIKIKGDSCLVSYNDLDSIGMLKNIGIDAYVVKSGAGMGISTRADYIEISNNNLTDVGYNGIFYRGTYTLIDKNIIKRFCTVLSDGGGVYTYGVGTGSILSNNIIYDDGSSYTTEVHGIYFDGGTDGGTIENNTVYGCTNTNSYGVFISRSKNITVTGNTLFNNEGQLREWQSDDGLIVENNSYSNNTFYSTLSSQKTAYFDVPNSVIRANTFSNNGYYNPQTFVTIKTDNSSYSPSGFEVLYGSSTGAEGFDSLMNYYENISYTSSNIIANSTFDTSTSGWGGDDSWSDGVGIGLDERCLKAYDPSNNAYIFTGQLSNSDTSLYRVSFDIITTETTEKVGYVSIPGSAFGSYILTTTRLHYEYFFERNGFSGALAFLTVNSADYIFYLDNVQFHTVTADAIDPLEKSKLFVNDTNIPKSFNLSGTYNDLDGKVVTGSITLQPFTSKILIKSSSTVSSTNSKPTINRQSFDINQDKKKDDFIGQVIASDPDQGQSLTYFIVSGNAEGLFAINSSTGVIFANSAISTATNATKVLEVQVTDDATDPLSASASITVNIVAPVVVPDVTSPTVSSFSIPANSVSLTVPVTSLVASDNEGVAGYLLTESSTVPLGSNSDWSTSAPTAYIFSTAGAKTLYAWAKDAAGNISGIQSASVTITLPPVLTSEDISICDGEAYLEWTSTGVYERTFKTILEADSIVTTNLTVNPVYNIIEEITINEGESYLTWNTSGQYERVLSSVTGCDSTVTTNLLVQEQSIFISENINICEGEAYLDWTESGEYERTLEAVSGADSIVTTNLVVNPVFYVTEEITIQEGESYQGWNTSGSYTRVLSSITGCDSTVTTNLIVLQTGYYVEDISICEGEDYLGWTNSGEYTRTLQATSGADSIVTTILTVNPVYNISEEVTIKEGKSYEEWNTSGTYERTLSSMAGCDSIVTTYLSVNPVYNTSEDVIINEGDYYLDWNTSGQYERILESIEGYDSIVTTNLIVLQPIYFEENISICNGESYMDWTSSGEYTRTLSAVSGADSIIITHLFVNPAYNITEEIKINEGENYLGWNTSGQYERILTSVSGCDSIVTTNLNVIPDILTTEDIYICEGEEYMGWTDSGEYERTLQSSSGADSIVTTNLYVNPVYNITEDININEGEEYFGWTEAGEYKRVLTSLAGCDSTVTTNLNVIPYIITTEDILTTEDIFICEGSSYLGWTVEGQYQRVLQAVSGADSIVTTNLWANPVYNITENITITEGEKYFGWTEAGEYQRALTTIAGCDSIVTTNLNVIQNILTQSIDLKRGWNIFSSNLIPSDVNMEAVQEIIRISGQLIEVQDELGNTYKNKANKGWINNIGNLQKPEGYKIRVKSPCVIEITGQPISLPLNIELKAGANLISFPYTESVNAMQIIQPLIDAGILEKVQDEKGSSIEYWDTAIGWINEIGNFNPGEGYLVQVSENGVLPIREVYEKSGSLLADKLATEYFKVDFEGNGSDHMNINIVGLNTTNFRIGDEIAAYDGEVCVGAVKLNEAHILTDAVSVNASLCDNNMINGYTEGNAIELKFWKAEAGQEIQLESEVIEGDMIYKMQASVFVTLNKQTTNVSDDFNSIEIDLYPNPANDQFTVRFSKLPAIGTQIILTDLYGRQIMSKEAQSTHEVLNIQSQPAGIYLVKTVNGNQQTVNKLIKR